MVRILLMSQQVVGRRIVIIFRLTGGNHFVDVGGQTSCGCRNIKSLERLAQAIEAKEVISDSNK